MTRIAWRRWSKRTVWGWQLFGDICSGEDDVTRSRQEEFLYEASRLDPASLIAIAFGRRAGAMTEQTPADVDVCGFVDLQHSWQRNRDGAEP